MGFIFAGGGGKGIRKKLLSRVVIPKNKGCDGLLRLPHTSRFFCRRNADFSSGSNRVKICRDISSPHTSRFFVATNRV